MQRAKSFIKSLQCVKSEAEDSNIIEHVHALIHHKQDMSG